MYRDTSDKRDNSNFNQKCMYNLPQPRRKKFSLLLGITKQLIIAERCSNFSYQKVWEKRSKKTIACGSSRIYFNNFKESYSGCGRDLKPVLNYQMSSASLPYGKIEDALICQAAVHKIDDFTSRTDYLNSLFCVTHGNWLVRFDLQHGRVLEKIDLQGKYKYRTMQWDLESHSLVLKSTQEVASDGALLSLAYFEVYPLKFIAEMEIWKSVFPKITGASVSQGLLILMFSSGLVKMYSFHRILQQSIKSNTVNIGEGSDTRLKINLTEEPPVLFELRCSDHMIEIGGSPWHYLYSPPNKHGIFHVTHVETNKQIGVLDLKLVSIEPHRAIFHPDESGRVIHIGNNILKVYEIKTKEDGSTYTDEHFTITISSSSTKKTEDDFPCVTQSGRIVRKKVSSEDVCDSDLACIDEVDYEDDLELLAVTSILSNPQGQTSEIRTRFYDNVTGELLKETMLDLKEPSDLFYEHNVTVDLDMIVQRYKPKHGDFRCVVYRLKRDMAEDGIT